jgi:hypothetical protein
MTADLEHEIFKGLKHGNVDVSRLIVWLKSESRYIAGQLKRRKIAYMEVATYFFCVSIEPSSRALAFVPGQTLREILRKTMLRMNTARQRARRKAGKARESAVSDRFMQSVAVINKALTSTDFIDARELLNSHTSSIAEFALLVSKRTSAVRAWVREGIIPTAEGRIRTAEALKALGLLSELVAGLVDQVGGGSAELLRSP